MSMADDRPRLPRLLTETSAASDRTIRPVDAPAPQARPSSPHTPIHGATTPNGMHRHVSTASSIASTASSLSSYHSDVASIFDSPGDAQTQKEAQVQTPVAGGTVTATGWFSTPSPEQTAARVARRRKKHVSLDIQHYLAALDCEQQTAASAASCAINQHVQQKPAGSVKLTGLLGSGAQAHVYRAEMDGQSVAVKRPNGLAAYAAIRREAAVLRHLHHSEGAGRSLVDFVQLVEGEDLMLVLGCAECNLMTHIERHRSALARHRPQQGVPLFGERGWARLARKVAASLTFLHAANFAHGDLKAENTLVFADTSAEDGISLKLADFESSASLDQASSFYMPSMAAGAMAGTNDYTAPEQLRLNASGPTKAADCFALGVLLLVLATGRTPYSEARSRIEAVMMAQAGEPLRYAPEAFRLSPAVERAVRGLCHLVPEERWTAEAAVSYLDGLAI